MHLRVFHLNLLLALFTAQKLQLQVSAENDEKVIRLREGVHSNGGYNF